MTPTTSSFRLSVRLGLAAFAIAGIARAQCTYSWPSSTFAGGTDDRVNCTTVDANGHLVVGGAFTQAGGTAANRIARWDGSAWHTYGTGMDSSVSALAVDANGDLLAGGNFTTSDGVTTNGIARWNGSSWQPFGGGLEPFVPFGGSVNAILVMPNGDIVIGGSFSGVDGIAANSIARWNGSTWSSLGLGIGGVVQDLALTPAGDIIVVGGFATAGGFPVARVARWTGFAWFALGSGIGNFTTSAVAVDDSGKIVVGGVFNTAGGNAVSNIAEFQGGTWSALGSGTNGPVASLDYLPTGDLIVGGSFTTAGGAPAPGVAMWDGSAWSGFTLPPNGTVLDTARASNGDVVVAGNFSQVGANAQGNLARIESSCAPQVTNLGPGCAGTGGLDTLTVTNLPSIGTSLDTTGSGFPTFAFVASVTGLSTVNVPLILALPQALPGCNLYANADVVSVLVPTAGQVADSIPIPNDASLIGASLARQYVSLETNAMLQFVEVTSSNGVDVTIGTF